jgi:hypothetical protein
MGVNNNFPWWVNKFSVVTLLILAWIFLIATTAAPAWGSTSYGVIGTSTGRYKSGLWSNCVGSYCTSVDESALTSCAKSGTKSCQEIMAARAFLVLALLLVSFSLILAILQCIGYFNSLNSVTTVMSALGWLFTLIGWAIATDAFVTTSKLTADACVGLGVIVWLLLAAAVGMNYLRDYDDTPLASKNNAANNNNTNNNSNNAQQNNNNLNVRNDAGINNSSAAAVQV